MKLSNGKIAIPIGNDIIMIIENDNIAKYIDGIEQQNEKLIEYIVNFLSDIKTLNESGLLKENILLDKAYKELEQIIGKKFEDIVNEK